MAGSGVFRFGAFLAGSDVAAPRGLEPALLMGLVLMGALAHVRFSDTVSIIPCLVAFFSYARIDETPLSLS
jgi:hypothetical protein